MIEILIVLAIILSLALIVLVTIQPRQNQLFSKIAGQLSQTNPASDLLDEIERYLEVFRNRSLPKTREEFETRATLLQLLREAKTFIQVKVDFYQKYGQ